MRGHARYRPISKKVNDTHGHPIGDQVIRSVARLFKQRLRKTDVGRALRWRNSLVILPQADAQRARQLLDRIRIGFSQFRHPAGAGHFLLHRVVRYCANRNPA